MFAAGHCPVCGRDKVAIRDPDRGMCILCYRLHYDEITNSDLGTLARLLYFIAMDNIKVRDGKRAKMTSWAEQGNQ